MPHVPGHNQVQVVDPNAGPEARGRDAISAALGRGGQERDAINQFFTDPRRSQEINRGVDVGLARALQGFGGQVDQRSRQEAFARARSGNIGGTAQAGQQARLRADALTGATDIAGQAEQQRSRQESLLQQQRQQELLSSFGIDPFTQQQIQAILQGQNVAGQGNQAAFALDEQRAQQDRFADDELSRAFGNVLNLGGNLFTIDQRAKMIGRQGIV